MKPTIIIGSALAFAAALFVVLVPHWVLPPIHSVSYGPPEAEMVVFSKPGQGPNIAPQPEIIEAAAQGIISGGSGYKNVQVLGGVSRAEFDRTMVALTRWVSPKQGCAFCHGGAEFNPAAPNYAADYPRKDIARQMLRMVRTINADWTNHVGTKGVTCYSCHRGENLPAERWYLDTPRTPPEGGILGKPQPWDSDAKTIRQFFPNRPDRMFLLQGLPANNVQSDHALATTAKPPFEHDRDYAEQVYIMMMQMSEGLGVNCTYCHQSRAIADWSQSPPARLHGYSGLKMTAAINQAFVAPLASLTPVEQRGKMGDGGKVNCKSCHGGLIDGVGGMDHVVYPALIGPIGKGPANPVAAANPLIPQLARAPKVGQPATDTLVEFRGNPQ